MKNPNLFPFFGEMGVIFLSLFPFYFEFEFFFIGFCFRVTFFLDYRHSREENDASGCDSFDEG